MIPSSRQAARKIFEAYRRRREQAEADAEARRERLHAQIPELKDIDAALAQTGLKLMREAMDGPERIERRIAAVRAENEQLQAIRRELLTSRGYPPDATEPHYLCAKCDDTGYVGIRLCDCIRAELARENYYESGIGSLLQDQDFDNFDLNRYSAADRAAMESIKRAAQDFASAFDPIDDTHPRRGLFFIGPPGTGKTHLSTAVAKTVIDRGFWVIYDTAQNIFTQFERERFGRLKTDEEQERTRDYMACDLLMIDDLGTEYSGNMTPLILYNLLNTRAMYARPILISTNLSTKEVLSKYDDRIKSRILGEFDMCSFRGRDMRVEEYSR